MSNAASKMAKDWNGWNPTPNPLLVVIKISCMEHGHDGLWNFMTYIISIDMKACHLASFLFSVLLAPRVRYGHKRCRYSRNRRKEYGFKNGTLNKVFILNGKYECLQIANTSGK